MEDISLKALYQHWCHPSPVTVLQRPNRPNSYKLNDQIFSLHGRHPPYNKRLHTNQLHTTEASSGTSCRPCPAHYTGGFVVYEDEIVAKASGHDLHHAHRSDASQSEIPRLDASHKYSAINERDEDAYSNRKPSQHFPDFSNRLKNYAKSRNLNFQPSKAHHFQEPGSPASLSPPSTTYPNSSLSAANASHCNKFHLFEAIPSNGTSATFLTAHSTSPNRRSSPCNLRVRSELSPVPRKHRRSSLSPLHSQITFDLSGQLKQAESACKFFNSRGEHHSTDTQHFSTAFDSAKDASIAICSLQSTPSNESQYREEEIEATSIDETAPSNIRSVGGLPSDSNAVYGYNNKCIDEWGDSVAHADRRRQRHRHRHRHSLRSVSPLHLPNEEVEVYSEYEYAPQVYRKPGEGYGDSSMQYIYDYRNLHPSVGRIHQNTTANEGRLQFPTPTVVYDTPYEGRCKDQVIYSRHAEGYEPPTEDDFQHMKGHRRVYRLHQVPPSTKMSSTSFQKHTKSTTNSQSSQESTNDARNTYPTVSSHTSIAGSKSTAHPIDSSLQPTKTRPSTHRGVKDELQDEIQPPVVVPIKEEVPVDPAVSREDIIDYSPILKLCNPLMESCCSQLWMKTTQESRHVCCQFVLWGGVGFLLIIALLIVIGIFGVMVL